MLADLSRMSIIDRTCHLHLSELKLYLFPKRISQSFFFFSSLPLEFLKGVKGEKNEYWV